MGIPSRWLPVMLIALASSSWAQELNYNSFQRGTRSAMMGGAAVAGVEDASAVFYNPAGLAFATDVGVDITAQALRWETIRFEDVLGNGNDVESEVVELVPLLIARVFPLDDEGTWQMGAAISAVQQQRIRVQEVIRTTRDILPDMAFPGPEPFAGRLDNSRQANEYWAAPSLGWRPSERLSFGVSPIISYRQQAISEQFTAALIPDPALPISNSVNRSHELYQFSWLMRMGMAWRPTDTFRVGLTAATPSQKIFGRGRALVEQSLTNIIVQEDGSLGSAYGLANQKNRDTNFRIPFNAEIGLEWDLAEDWTVATSLQYWDRLQRRAVIDVNPFEPFIQGVPLESDNSSSRVLTIYDERQEVLNISLGVEHRISPAYRAYLGFWTDFSPIDGGEAKEAVALRQPLLSQTSLDVYNFVTGFSHRGEHTIITVGATVGFGQGSRYGPSVDFFSDEPNQLFGTSPVPRKSDVTSISGGVIFSYQYLF